MVMFDKSYELFVTFHCVFDPGDTLRPAYDI